MMETRDNILARPAVNNKSADRNVQVSKLICTQILKQVAQRATIAHLTASHQNILNSSQVKDFFKLIKGS